MSISCFAFTNNLSISPNPTSGLAEINLTLSQHAEVGISIYAFNGTLVEVLFQANVKEFKHQIDLSEYANGLYFARFSVNKQTTKKGLVLHK